jgi:hypothetical protein
LLLAARLVAPSGALAASTECLCNNGKTMHTTSDAEDACASVCDLFGGGSAVVPEDDAIEPAAEDAAPTRRRVVVSPPKATPPGSPDPQSIP